MTGRPHAAARQFHRRAGAFLDVFPGIALVIDFRGALAGGARAGGAVVLAGHRDAVALYVSGSSVGGGHELDARQGGCDGTGENCAGKC